MSDNQNQTITNVEEFTKLTLLNLRNQNLTVEEISKKMGISSRTIFRKMRSYNVKTHKQCA